jgi:hypothetical protein
MVYSRSNFENKTFGSCFKGHSYSGHAGLNYVVTASSSSSQVRRVVQGGAIERVMNRRK